MTTTAHFDMDYKNGMTLRFNLQADKEELRKALHAMPLPTEEEGMQIQSWFFGGSNTCERLTLNVNKHYGNRITVYVIQFDGITLYADTNKTIATAYFYDEFMRRFIAEQAR